MANVQIHLTLSLEETQVINEALKVYTQALERKINPDKEIQPIPLTIMEGSVWFSKNIQIARKLLKDLSHMQGLPHI